MKAKIYIIRFRGFNQTACTPGSISIPEKEESVFWAKAPARLGANIVRNQYDTAGKEWFQDWDGIMLYTWEPKVSPDFVGYVGDNRGGRFQLSVIY